MSIHLTQYLCENRHCIVAVTWELGQCTLEEVERVIKTRMEEMKINPWCGLCGSTKLHFEDGVTRFGSVAEALPSLKACAEDQALTRLICAQLPKPN